MSQKERERIKQFTLHHLTDAEHTEVVLPKAVSAICERHHVHNTNADPLFSLPSVTLVESLALHSDALPNGFLAENDHGLPLIPHPEPSRSEERRVGKECLRLCRSRWSPYH